MKPYLKSDKKVVGAITILSGVVGLACLLIGFEATHYDAEAFSNPVKLLSMPSVNVGQVRWFMILDLFGYYLLLLPVLFFLQRELDLKTPWASLLTSLGYGYVIIGAIGAATLAVIWPDLLIRHRDAPENIQLIVQEDFLLATNFVVKGLWNHLEVLLGGVWWIGVGIYAMPNRPLKITTLVLGASCLIDSIGEMLQWPVIAEIGLNAYLILGIVWPIWIGTILWRNRY
jgi:hypothetical protein